VRQQNSNGKDIFKIVGKGQSIPHKDEQDVFNNRRKPGDGYMRKNTDLI
jgi:hypothetical protein